MKRIVIAAVIVSFVSVGAFPASKPKAKTKKAAAVPSAQAVSAPIPLAALFPAPSQETVSAGGMVMMDAPNHEVVLVRINDDGTQSHACVNDETAARKFLSATKSAAAPAKQGN